MKRTEIRLKGIKILIFIQHLDGSRTMMGIKGFRKLGFRNLSLCPRKLSFGMVNRFIMLCSDY